MRRLTPKRTCKFLCVDFEEYAGPLFFAYDMVFFAPFVFVLYAALVASPPPHPVSTYVLIGLLLFALIVLNRAIFTCFEVHIVSDAMKTNGRCDLMKTLLMCITSFTGIRVKHLCEPVSWLQTASRISFFPLFVSLFFASGVYFLLEVAVHQSNVLLLETFTSYPSSITEPACIITTTIDQTVRVFFTVTNNAAVMDILLALDGMYFNIIQYRMRARTYYQLVLPKLKQVCDGGYQVAIFDDSVIGVCATVCFGVAVLLCPFVLFRDGRKMLHNKWIWLFTFVAAAAAFIAYFFLSAVGIQFFALVIPGSSWTRVASTAGYQAFVSLGIMAAMALCLVVSAFISPPSSTTAGESNADSTETDPLKSFVQGVMNIGRLFVKLIVCEGALLAYVTLFLAILAGGFGLPLHDISFERVEGASPWPSMMDENAFERALLNPPSDDFVKDTFTNIITSVTEMNGALLTDLCKKILKKIDPTGVASLVCPGLNFLTDTYKQLQIESVDVLFQGVEVLGGAALQQLNTVMHDVIGLFHVDFGIEDFIKDVVEFVKKIPPLLQYIPAVCVGLMLLLTLLRVIVPPVATFVQIAVITALLQLVVFSVAVVMSIRLLLRQYNYRIIVNIDYPLLAFDFIVVLLTIASCFLLLQAEEQKLRVDAEVQQLIREFEVDYGSGSVLGNGNGRDDDEPNRVHAAGETQTLLLQRKKHKQLELMKSFR